MICNSSLIPNFAHAQKLIPEVFRENDPFKMHRTALELVSVKNMLSIFEFRHEGIDPTCLFRAVSKPGLAPKRRHVS